MVEVGGKLVDQFAANLAKLLAGEPATRAAAAGETAPGRRVAGPADGTAPTVTAAPVAAAEPAQEDSLNLLKLVGPSILKRALPVIAAAGLAVAGGLIWRRRGRKSDEA